MSRPEVAHSRPAAQADYKPRDALLPLLADGRTLDQRSRTLRNGSAARGVFTIPGSFKGLLPEDPHARARAITWMFAALNTVEPPIIEYANARILEQGKPWYEERLPVVADRVRAQLRQLAAHLGDAEWLDGAFSAADLLMVSVLLRTKPSGILNEFPALAAYVSRGEARPAYQRAFEAQLAVYKASLLAAG